MELWEKKLVKAGQFTAKCKGAVIALNGKYHVGKNVKNVSLFIYLIWISYNSTPKN